MLSRRIYHRLRGANLGIGLDVDRPVAVLGSRTAAWPAPLGTLSATSVVYAFGVGTDISYELELSASTGCEVHLFDPTPRSMEWVERQTLPPSFTFHPLGLAAKEGPLVVHPPRDPRHVSFNAFQPSAAEAASASVPVSTLRSILTQLNHRELDVLKMDIEGSEYDVIDDIDNWPTLPNYILVEFHHQMYGFDRNHTNKSLSTLRHHDYLVYYISDVGREFGLVRWVNVGGTR